MKTGNAQNRSEESVSFKRSVKSVKPVSTGAATRESSKSPFVMKTVLVPIDFSNCSRKALQYAVPMAKQHSARLVLLHVLPPSYRADEYGGMDYGQLESQMRKEGERDLAELVQEEIHGEVATETLVRIGSPTWDILEAAKALPADLIVISTHGRTGLPHLLLGSVAEHVVQGAPCPVLVVREREHEMLAPSPSTYPKNGPPI